MVTTVYIVRHGESQGNVGGRFQGRFDAALSENGQKQIELLGLRFRNEPIAAVYSSPLKRAMKTAEAVAGFHSLPVREMKGLIEIDVGEMEDMKLSEISEKFPETARNWDSAPDLCEFPGGETMSEVYKRANETLDRIVLENIGKTVLVVTHGGVIRNLFARVTFGNLQGIRETTIFSNTGVSTLKVEKGRLFWDGINDISHIPEELRRSPTKYIFHTEAI